MTTDIKKQDSTEQGAMSTATPTRAPHSDVPTGHQQDSDKVGAGLFDPKALVKSLPDAIRKLHPRSWSSRP